MRNYKQMGNDKFKRVAAEGVPASDVETVEAEINKRGMDVTIGSTTASEAAEAIIKPMLAKAAKEVNVGPDYIIEPKLDGHRGIAQIESDSVVIRSRPGAIISENIPYITKQLERLPPGTVLDGELYDAAFKDRGRVQKITKRSAVHVYSPDDPAIHYVVFDILEYAGVSMRDRTLQERKIFLKKLYKADRPGNPFLVYLNPWEPASEEALQRFLNEGFEGGMVKKLSGTYNEGSRSGWEKCKPDQEIDVLCTGIFLAEPGSKYDGIAVGGITYDYYNRDDGSVYQGKCAGKMNDDLRKDLLKHSERYVGLVVELGHWGITKDGVPLHPSFRRFRDDKVANEL